MYVLGRILRKQQHSLEERHMSGTTDFDFWLHTWDVVNKRKKVRSLYDDPESNLMLGWTSWIKNVPLVRDPGEAILQM